MSQETGQDVYVRLREFLDRMPGGYPATDTGVELKILEKLFTPEQAELAMQLTPMPEPVSAIAQRLGADETELAERLETMAKEGSLLRVRSKGKPMYAAVSFVIGIFEFHLNTLDRELAELLHAYFPLMTEAMKSVKTQQLRVVPIGSALDDDRAVATYDRIRDLVKHKTVISAGPCICGKENELLGGRCDHAFDRCIQFDVAARYYIENGLSRQIDHQELAAILKRGEEEGLVVCPTNAKEISNICMCCGCCCNFLKALRRFERPADHVQAPFQAHIDPELCVSCGTCEERCRVEAIRDDGEGYAVDTARCIGCGLCVPECPEGAISMVDKPEVCPVPENIVDMNIKLAQERGVM